MAVRNPDDGGKQSDSYNVVIGIDSLDTVLSRINLKFIVCGVAIVMLVMVMLGFAFCLYSGIHHDKPRYFFLLSNLILSAVITGTLLFWLWRGTLSVGVAWYVFLQCFFLFFICVTTDIFAWYAPKTANNDGQGGGTHGGNHTTPTPPCHNCTSPDSAESLWHFKP